MNDTVCRLCSALENERTDFKHVSTRGIFVQYQGNLFIFSSIEKCACLAVSPKHECLMQ